MGTLKRPVVLATVGLIAGLGIALFLGWIVWPVQYYDTEFPFLHPAYKFEYALMVGAAYELDGDWERAESRLASLEEPDIGVWVRDQIHLAIAAGEDPVEIRHLINLAKPLGVKTDIMDAFAGSGGG